MKKKFLVLSHNGDPFGGGFTASEYENRNDQFGVYRGDIGAMPRSFWRTYARKNDYVLVEVR